MPRRDGPVASRRQVVLSTLETGIDQMTRHSPFEIGIAAAETIARRLPIMWWGMMQPTAASQAEMVKMVIEKQMALADGLFAMQMEVFKMAMRPWRDLRPEARHGDAEAVLQAAIAPAARRVKANLRRLRRKQERHPNA